MNALRPQQPLQTDSLKDPHRQMQQHSHHKQELAAAAQSRLQAVRNARPALLIEGGRNTIVYEQDQQVRESGKSRDDLQSVIALVKKGGFDLPLQFTNFRD